MGKRKLTGSEKELHKKATAIRKRFSSMSDSQLVEMFAEMPKADDAQQETASDIISEFIERLSTESIWGIGKITIKKNQNVCRGKGIHIRGNFGMIRECLKNYYLMEQLIKECDEELEIIEAKLYASPTFDTSGIPKNPSPRNRIEDTYIDIIQRKENLTAQREEYKSIKERVEQYIDGISDLLTHKIFEKHVLQKKTFKVIADELGGNNTESSVNKAYNRYIRDNPE